MSSAGRPWGWAVLALSSLAACTCDTGVRDKKFVCASDADCDGVPCVAGVCGGTAAGGGAGGGAAGGSAGGEAGGSAGGEAGGSAGGTAGGSAGGTAGGSAGGTAGGSAGGTAGGSAGGTAGGSAGGSSDAGMDGGVDAGTPAQLAFTTAPFSIPAGACSPRVTVEVQTSAGAPIPVSSATAVTLAAGTAAVYSDAACTVALGGLLIPVGASSAGFHVRGVTGGSVNLTASATSLASAMQTETILDVVRRGTCQISAGVTAVTCTVSPPVSATTRALLVFQAAGTDPTPNSAVIRCQLAGAGIVSCDRFGTNGTVRIAWQVAELPWVAVTHLTTACPGVTQVALSIPAVTPAQTFLLASHMEGGIDIDNDDFLTHELTGATTAQLASSPNNACDPSLIGALQLVDAPGVSVTRGAIGAFGDAGTVVGGLPSASTSTSALLFGHSLSAYTLIPNICERGLRGELANDTTLSFTRGHGNADAGCWVPEVARLAYERVDFGTRASVQQFTVTMNPGTGSAVVTITPVDTTRSIVFASGQALCGQGLGEGSYTGNDTLAELCATFTLTSSTQVQVQRDSAFGAAKWTGYVVQLNP